MPLCSSAACFCSLTYFNVFAIDSAMSVPDVGPLPKSPFRCQYVHYCAILSILPHAMRIVPFGRILAAAFPLLRSIGLPVAVRRTPRGGVIKKNSPNSCICQKKAVLLQSMHMNKEEVYKEVLAQAGSVVSGETDLIANMANVAALLHEAFCFWWTGFYRVVGCQPSELVLGPFQGPLACTRIPFGKGVCGTAWAKAETIIVPNVHEFAGHIACSSESNSEIVVPVFQDGEIIGVLDIDSKEYNTFDETDKRYLEQIVSLM